MISLTLLLFFLKILKYCSSSPVNGISPQDLWETEFDHVLIKSQHSDVTMDDTPLWKRSDVNSTRSFDDFSKMMIDQHVMLIISCFGAIFLLISSIISLIVYRSKKTKADLESKKYKVIDLGVFHDNPLYKDPGVV
jgi:hypothetical protein